MTRLALPAPLDATVLQPVQLTVGAPKRRVRIGIARFWAGARPEEMIDLLFPELKPFYEFETSPEPDVVLYGPYGGPMPAGSYAKVFIGCENILPIMSECDWAFGVAFEEAIRHPRYMRFRRWGDDSHLLLTQKDWNKVLRDKTRFCAFVYSNSCPYREAFFRALSCYKCVDSPGRSMNNMPSIDAVPLNIDWQQTKIEFLRRYKFVVAFENSSRPGYNTEKLTHPVDADSLPIYWGDPAIGRSFNEDRFINAHRYLPAPLHILPKLPNRAHSLAPAGQARASVSIARRINQTLENFEQSIWAARGFDRLIDEIVRIDNDNALYVRYLSQPLLPGNRLPDRDQWVARWHEIFAQCPSRH